MAGIGEASAIIGVLQAGFSLATTLHGYVGDYKDARDDIISLATDIEATLYQVQALNDLVKSNKAAKSLDDNGLKQADNCVTESDKLVKKIIKLLAKAGVPESPSQVIKPEDINVSRFTRAYWPLWYKPSVEVVKRQLDSLRLKILLARSCIEARSGSTAAVRSEASSRIVGLAKSKQLAQLQLRKAKAAQAKTMSQAHSGKPPPRRSRVEERRPAISFADDTFSGPPRRSTNQSGFSMLSSDDGRDTDAIAEKLREEIRQDIQQQEVERLIKEAAEKKARELAVDHYKEEVKQRLLTLQQHANETQRHLEAVFGATLNADQVKQYVQEQQAQEMKDELGQLLLQATAESKGHLASAPSEDLNPPSATVTATRSRRGWFSRRGSTQQTQAAQASRLGTRPSSWNAASDMEFAHLALTYSALGGDIGTNECHPFDVSGIQHNPCGDHCDIDATMKVWAQVPRAAKDSALRCVSRHFGNKRWLLHSAYFRDQGTRGSRRLLQRAILGSVVSTGLINVLLTYSASNDDGGREDPKAGPGPSKESPQEASAEEVASPDGFTQPLAERLRKFLSRETAWTESEVEQLMRYMRQGVKFDEELPSQAAGRPPTDQPSYPKVAPAILSQYYPGSKYSRPPTAYASLPYQGGDYGPDNPYEKPDPLVPYQDPYGPASNPYAPDGRYPPRTDTFDRGRSSYLDPIVVQPPPPFISPPPPPAVYRAHRPPSPPFHLPPGARHVPSMTKPDRYRQEEDLIPPNFLMSEKRDSGRSRRDRDRDAHHRKESQREYELRKEREFKLEREIADLEMKWERLEGRSSRDSAKPADRSRQKSYGGGESETRRGRSDLSNGHTRRNPLYDDHRSFYGRHAYVGARRGSYSSSESDSDVWSRRAQHGRHRRDRSITHLRPETVYKRSSERSPSLSRVKFSGSPTAISELKSVAVDPGLPRSSADMDPLVNAAQESGSEAHSSEDDVVLSDDDLRNKMIVKYTGGNAASATAGAEATNGMNGDIDVPFTDMDDTARAPNTSDHTPRLDEETQATEPGVDAADSGLMRGSISAADASSAHLDRDIDVVEADPPSGRDHHGTIPDDIVEIIDERYSIRGSDRDSAASRRSLEIIEEGIPARAEHKAKKPRRVAETVERYPAYTSTDGRVVDDDIIEVIEDHADTAREQKSRTRIMLPIRFVHHQAFDELDLKVTKDFRDRVQLEARGEVDLDVGFGTKEHIDRIVALSEKHWGERDTAGVKAESSTADNGKALPSDNDDHPSAPVWSVSSDDYYSASDSRTSEGDEIIGSLQFIKIQSRPAPDPNAYVGGIIAPKLLVHRRAMTQSGFRVIRDSRDSWHAVPHATMPVGVEKGSSREFVEKIMALSEECFEKGDVQSERASSRASEAAEEIPAHSPTAEAIENSAGEDVTRAPSLAEPSCTEATVKLLRGRLLRVCTTELTDENKHHDQATTLDSPTTLPAVATQGANPSRRSTPTVRSRRSVISELFESSSASILSSCRSSINGQGLHLVDYTKTGIYVDPSTDLRQTEGVIALSIDSWVKGAGIVSESASFASDEGKSTKTRVDRWFVETRRDGGKMVVEYVD